MALERGEIRFTVVFGTKGHRPRETHSGRWRSEKVLENATAVAEQRDGRLIDKPSRQQAVDYWRKEIAKTGLTGYLYPAVIPLCMDAGCAPPISGAGIQSQEALALTSMDLGHGDGRGRYVVRVYGRREEE